jgi:hypothetical protein
LAAGVDPNNAPLYGKAMNAPTTSAIFVALMLLAAACSKRDASAEPHAGQGGGGGAPDSGGSAATAGTAGETAGTGGSSTNEEEDAGDASDAGDGVVDARVLDSAIDASSDAASDPPLDNACLDGIDGYTSAGPFAFETAMIESVRLWLPSVPSGCHVPVVSFANGTGAQCSTYAESFEHLASHGFMIACYDTPNTGDGTRCQTAIEVAFETYPELVDRRVGIGGHVQGGGSATECVQRAEEHWGSMVRIAGFGAQPEHGFGGMSPDFEERYAQIRSPMFVFHGTEAGGASWVGDGFELLDPSTEAYWYAAVGAQYIPVPFAWINEAAVAWFRWQLLDDEAACRYFRDTMPQSSAWDLEATHSPRACAP